MRSLYFIDLALTGSLLLVLLMSGLSIRLRQLLNFPLPAQVTLFFIIMMLGYSAIQFPLSLYQGLILPRRYGLSTQSFWAWLLDEVKGSLLVLVLGTGVIVLVYWLLENFPETWWLLAAAFMLCLSIVLTNLAPVVILPLFFNLKPLGDPNLTQRLTKLAERAQKRVRGAFIINLSSKGTTANAALMGLSNTKRMILTDTLLGRYSPEEIEVIMAHELGHHAHHDIVKLILAQSAVILSGLYLANLVLRWAVPRFGYSSLADVAALPLLALVLGSFFLLIAPIKKAYSRQMERSADEYALNLTSNPEAFITMLTKLTDQNLSQAHPSRWVELLFYDHPPYSKRVAQARRYATRLSVRHGETIEESH